MKINPIYEKALKHFGADAQYNLLIEEMSKLTKAICKRTRGFDSDAMIIEELIDVEIMLSQIKMLFPASAINRARVGKIKRLEALIKKSEAEK